MLPGVFESSVAYGDYDNDCDLDILLTGYSDRNKGDGNKGDVYDFMLFSESFYFLQENFNVWIEEKHKIIDVPFLS